MTVFAAGFRVLRADDAARGRPVLIDVWYPGDPDAREADHDYGLGRGLVAEGAPIADGRWPVIVLSHGAFGAAGNYSWIAEHLARRGYLVAGVSHYLESYVYGQATIDPSAATRPWLRPPDCSFALDHLAGHPIFGPAIDRSRVGALGHSSGGATVIALGGAVFDPAAIDRYCASAAAALDMGCAYSRGAPTPRMHDEAAGRSYRDDRVRAIVALDPALGPGYSGETLAGIAVPVLVVGAVDNDFLPFAHHAAHYAASIPGASLTRLAGGEGHFVYLDACDTDRDANGVPLCRDRPGVDRREVHAVLADVIAAFFDERLAPS